MSLLHVADAIAWLAACYALPLINTLLPAFCNRSRLFTCCGRLHAITLITLQHKATQHNAMAWKCIIVAVVTESSCGALNEIFQTKKK